MQTIKEEPTLESIESPTKISEQQTQQTQQTQQASSFTEYTEQEFNRLINKDRINNMETKMKNMKDRIVHLMSVRDRWRSAHFALRILGIVSTSVFSIATTVINVIPKEHADVTMVRILTAFFSAITLVTTAATEGTAGAFTYRNFEKYNKRIRELENHINRCWLIYDKARKDRIISDEELDMFFETLRDYDEFTSVSLE